MAVQAIDSHSLVLVPPLDMPFRLRMQTGRFGAPRIKEPDQEPPCSQNFTHPHKEDLLSHSDAPFGVQIHEAIDLDSEPGNCVYAAYSGRVLEVEILGEGTKGHVKIDHHVGGLGYVTKYNHVTGIQVSKGDFVQKGQPFASVASAGGAVDEPHLHFELWLVIDRNVSPEGGPNDSDMVPIDPTRWLYHWEQEFAEEASGSPDPQVPNSIAIIQGNHFPFFEAKFITELEFEAPQLDASISAGPISIPTRLAVPYYVPLYEPTTLDERVMVEMLRDAFHHQREVTINYRWSEFFDRRIITTLREL